MTIADHGTQRVAINNAGCRVYGGSALVCVHGGWESLERLPMPRAVRLAAAQAKLYEDGMREYPGFMVSRRNYDVAQGLLAIRYLAKQVPKPAAPIYLSERRDWPI
jgi:hypothetical protein